MLSSIASWPLLALLLAMPPAAAWLLRRAGLPGGAMGAAVAGGLLMGIILGPSIFGRVHPTLFDSMILGAADESQALRLAQRQHGAELLVAEHARLNDTELLELHAKHERELVAPRAVLQRATDSHQSIIWLVALLLITALLLALGSQSVPVNAESKAPAPGFWLSAINIGMASAIVPGAIAFLITFKLWDAAIASAAFIAAALAIGPAALRREEQIDADNAELNGAAMLHAAARVATLITVIGLAVALIVSGLSISWWSLAPLLALPAAWILASPLGSTLQRVGPLIHHIAVPIITAITALNVDLFRDVSIWPLLVILLFSDDGRGIGAMLGAMLPGGRRALRGLRLALGTVAAGPTQLAVTAVGVHAGLIPLWAVLPLLLGVVLIEATSALRHRLATQIGQLDNRGTGQESGDIT